MFVVLQHEGAELIHSVRAVLPRSCQAVVMAILGTLAPVADSSRSWTTAHLHKNDGSNALMQCDLLGARGCL